jgi:acyl carrier protein
MLDFVGRVLKEEIHQTDGGQVESAKKRADRNPNSKIENISYTLQVGRDAMEERLGIIVESIQALEEKLQGFVEGRVGIEGLYRGKVKGNKETLAVLTADGEMQEAIDKWVQRKKYSKLLNLWVKGLDFDWNKLYGDSERYGTSPRRIPLPTYPFSRKRYWLPELVDPKPGSDTPATVSFSDQRPKTGRTAPSTRDQEPETADPKKAAKGLIETVVAEVLVEVLETDTHEFPFEKSFEDFGVDSILAVEIIQKINKRLRLRLRNTDLYNYPTIGRLIDYIGSRYNMTPASYEGSGEILDGIESPTVVGHESRSKAAAAPESTEDAFRDPDGDALKALLVKLENGELDVAEVEKRMEGMIDKRPHG